MAPVVQSIWSRRACVVGVAAAWLVTIAPSPAHSDEAKDDPPSVVKEVGGRLVIDGETVEVVADTDVPPHDSSIATKTDTPLLETPRSVSLMDRHALDDLQVVNVSQAHDYTVGLSPEDERGPGFARGFRLGFYDLRRDGLRTYTWSVREPVALDRVQYLRGPAAVLYGDGSSGGLVNLVLKKPLPAKRVEASAGAGERGFRRFTADATGPLKGIELEAVGSPVRGLAVRGGYAWTRTEITRDTSGFTGRELPNAPPHKANFWLQYRVPSGALRGLMAGAGVVYVSDRFTSRDNAVRVPAYTRLDATASYALGSPRLTLALAALNLTNALYVTSGTGRIYFVGPPRRLSLTLGALF